MFDRDRIVHAVDLRALADELLGPRRGTARSGMWSCPNPQHAQTGRTPPVSIFRTSDGEERWHCHGCAIGGSAIDLVMAARELPVRDAIEELAARAGLRDRQPPIEAVRSQSRIQAPAGRAAVVADQDGLDAYVEECAQRLWRPEGRPVLRWLTRARGLPEDVLRANRIGADPGRRGQARPDGMPSAGWAAVLPAWQGGQPVFAQLRALNERAARPRYLNAASRLAPNPRVAVYEPAEKIRACVVVTEGVIDALSANAAGFRAAAVLGAAMVGIGGDGPAAKEVVVRLMRGDEPLVIAFDADPAGDRGAQALQELLRSQGAKVTRLHVPAHVNDLNTWMLTSREWETTMAMAVRAAVMTARRARGIGRP